MNWRQLPVGTEDVHIYGVLRMPGLVNWCTKKLSPVEREASEEATEYPLHTHTQEENKSEDTSLPPSKPVLSHSTLLESLLWNTYAMCQQTRTSGPRVSDVLTFRVPHVITS